MFSQKNANSFFPTSWQVDYMLTLQSHLYLHVTSHADIHRALSQIPCPQAFVGQDCMMSQKNITQQSFIMSLKCNLGIVNLEAMLVSSFPNNAGGGMMHLAGHLMTVACLQFFATSISQSLVVCLPFQCCFIFSRHPSLFSSGPGKYWLISIPLNSSV